MHFFQGFLLENQLKQSNKKSILKGGRPSINSGVSNVKTGSSEISGVINLPVSGSKLNGGDSNLIAGSNINGGVGNLPNNKQRCDM